MLYSRINEQCDDEQLNNQTPSSLRLFWICHSCSEMGGTDQNVGQQHKVGALPLAGKTGTPDARTPRINAQNITQAVHREVVVFLKTSMSFWSIRFSFRVSANSRSKLDWALGFSGLCRSYGIQRFKIETPIPEIRCHLLTWHPVRPCYEHCFGAKLWGRFRCHDVSRLWLKYQVKRTEKFHGASKPFRYFVNVKPADNPNCIDEQAIFPNSKEFV